MSFGLFILRVVIGVLFVGHGTQKLFGWFGGPGIDGAEGMFGSLGYRKPRTMAVLAGVAEAGAGVLLVLGFLVPLAAAAIIGVMVNAIATVHAGNGPWVSDGGWEYNLVLITAGTAFAFSGPGWAGLDPALGWGLAEPGWGVAAVVAGLVAAGITLALREKPAAAEAQADTEAQDQERRAA